MCTELYIMTGLPYSGKTTLSMALKQHLGCAVVSVDRIMDDRGMWRNGPPKQEAWNEAYSEAYRQLENLLGSGLTVIFDCANLPFRERENARNIAEKVGVAHKLIFVKAPMKEILRRRQANETTKERGHLTGDMMADARRLFEEPRDSEHPILYSSDFDLPRWIRDNID